MNFKYELTNKVKKFINDAELSEINIGCSDSQVIKILKDKKIIF